MLRVLPFTHALIAEVLNPGAWAIDATAGNGHDTLTLAEQVGPQGHVWAFDLQAAALRQTRRRLEAAGLADRCTLLHQSHAELREALPPDAQGQVQAMMFNLGYLPGSGEKDIITRPATTLPALEAACRLLAPGGLITVVLYPSHPGGADEAASVEHWTRALDPHTWQVLRYGFINQRGTPPYLIAIERIGCRK